MLRYSNKPVLHYGSKPIYEENELYREITADTLPIASAPRNSAVPIEVVEPNTQSHYAMFYRNAWHVMEKVRDEYTGREQWRMSQETVANPVRWRELK
jgi:hypothetical protein